MAPQPSAGSKRMTSTSAAPRGSVVGLQRSGPPPQISPHITLDYAIASD